ncbi:MAG: DUF1269 domain-containing protein [Acidobacteria bacterium]|nr:DUF1269 domain-containing protein [Acidobacteriota bacterium]
MSNLVVVGFKNNKYKASGALNKLRQMEYDWSASLDDAVSAYRDYNGKLRIDQSYELTTGEGAGWGVFWGSLIGGLLAAPFTAGASAAVAASAIGASALGGAAVGGVTGAVGAAAYKEDFGIPEDFVKDVGDMIQPGDSAIFALLNADPVDFVDQFEGFGGKVLMTTLSPTAEITVQEVLNKRYW